LDQALLYGEKESNEIKILKQEERFHTECTEKERREHREDENAT